ncbi:MAG: hypothetical protein LLG16_02870 [Euryarchaeota archaeon]|nr:hypothetical protein [Euryarchaeota archaeon]
MSIAGMDFDWRILLFAWLILGIASSMLVYWDMDRRKKVKGVLALICIPLCVFGLLIYFLFRGKIEDRGRNLPPKPNYGKPEYRFKDEQKPATTEEPEKVAAPEPVPVKEAEPKPNKEEGPFPEPPAAKRPDIRLEEGASKSMDIEGIPRCPKCRAAVSSFDTVCGECGAKLK